MNQSINNNTETVRDDATRENTATNDSNNNEKNQLNVEVQNQPAYWFQQQIQNPTTPLGATALNHEANIDTNKKQFNKPPENIDTATNVNPNAVTTSLNTATTQTTDTIDKNEQNTEETTERIVNTTNT